jgi:hypothetical protein
MLKTDAADECGERALLCELERALPLERKPRE